MTIGYDGVREFSPGESRAAHKHADTDSSPFAIHHTLGPKKNQAAPGDHSHFGTAKYWDAAIRNMDGSAVAHTPVLYRYWTDGEWVKFILIVGINDTSGQFIKFDLPVARLSFPGIQISIGNGVEITSTGQHLTIAADTLSTGYIVGESAANTGTNNYYLDCRGEYPIKYD